MTTPVSPPLTNVQTAFRLLRTTNNRPVHNLPDEAIGLAAGFALLAIAEQLAEIVKALQSQQGSEPIHLDGRPSGFVAPD